MARGRVSGIACGRCRLHRVVEHDVDGVAERHASAVVVLRAVYLTTLYGSTFLVST